MDKITKKILYKYINTNKRKMSIKVDEVAIN